jgi:hypothetical protein
MHTSNTRAHINTKNTLTYIHIKVITTQHRFGDACNGIPIFCRQHCGNDHVNVVKLPKKGSKKSASTPLDHNDNRVPVVSRENSPMCKTAEVVYVPQGLHVVNANRGVLSTGRVEHGVLGVVSLAVNTNNNRGEPVVHSLHDGGVLSMHNQGVLGQVNGGETELTNRYVSPMVMHNSDPWGVSREASNERRSTPPTCQETVNARNMSPRVVHSDHGGVSLEVSNDPGGSMSYNMARERRLSPVEVYTDHGGVRMEVSNDHQGSPSYCDNDDWSSEGGRW